MNITIKNNYENQIMLREVIWHSCNSVICFEKQNLFSLNSTLIRDNNNLGQKKHKNLEAIVDLKNMDLVWYQFWIFLKLEISVLA